MTCQTKSVSCPCRVVVLKRAQAPRTTTLKEYLRGMPEGQSGVLFQVVVGNVPQNVTKKLLEQGYQVKHARSTKSCCMGTSRGAGLGRTVGYAPQPMMGPA